LEEVLMIVSQKMHKLIVDQEGWTRKMFEEGLRLKKTYGEDKVYDFSLGNPDVEPPLALQEALVDILTHATRGMHRYMENNGYEDVREEIATYLTSLYGVSFTGKHVFMTVGCAGGINVLLKAMLNKRDEVRLADSRDDFQLDVDNIERAINERTKAILINSPNNPTGAVYGEENLKDLADLLYRKRREGQEIYIIADEAYKKIVYDHTRLPNLFQIYDLVMSVTSHSKDLALPGERIGYIALSPEIKDVDLLVSGLMISGRALGFVNAPALFQRVVGKFQGNSVDISDYQKKRDILYGVLIEAGFECVKPEGAFYMFPRSPIENDLEFVQKLQREERILVVPGRGFGKPGYFRIAYCVPLQRILDALEGFKRIGKYYIRKG
jgi:aspartate aminotransferase